MKAIRFMTPIYLMNNNKAANLLEYVVLIVIVLSALFVMKDTIGRGLFAKYKVSGDSFAFGRQYDARRTTVCRQDVLSYNADGKANLGPLYDEECYHARVNRPLNENGCPQCRPGDEKCFACEDAVKASCASEYCKT